MKKIFLFPLPPPKLKRKPMGNTLGTCWNKGKMKQIFLCLPIPQKNLRENPWGTNWEPVEQRENEKNLPLSPRKLFKKKQDTFSAG
jgi:hypothetical protein